MKYTERFPFPGTVLVVCKSNVGRSQMMVGFLRELLDAPIMGAGVEALKDKYNNRPHSSVTDEMRKRGIDISQQPITQLTEDLVFPDTTAIILCDPSFVPKYVFRKARLVLCPPVKDPYDDGLSSLEDVADELYILAGLFVLSTLNEAEFPNRNLAHTYDDMVFPRHLEQTI